MSIFYQEDVKVGRWKYIKYQEDKKVGGYKYGHDLCPVEIFTGYVR